MSLNGVIASLSTGVYTVTRTTAVPRQLGRSQPGVESTFTVTASIQPAAGRQLQDLPEGQRGDETISVFTDVELRTRAPSGAPDIIAYRGEPWAVVTVRVCEGFGETHYECLAQRAPLNQGGVVP